jgi:type IV secretory pathway VirB6-like protein
MTYIGISIIHNGRLKKTNQQQRHTRLMRMKQSFIIHQTKIAFEPNNMYGMFIQEKVKMD